MDSTIIAALIGLFGVVILVIMNQINRHLDSKQKYLSISKSRQFSLISNKWIGEGRDLGKNNEPIFTYTINVFFKIKRNRIYGTGDIIRSDEISFQVELEGGLITDSYLRFNYQSKDKSVLRYGVMFLKLSPEGNKLYGKFFGLGTIKEDLVEGEVNLSRIDS